MIPRCSVFIATSLDGYVARDNGSIDWLEKANATVPVGEDCGYGEFFSTVDALVVGRNTLEQALSFPEWPYAAKPVHVFSRTMQVLPAKAPPTVRLVTEQTTALLRSLMEQGANHVYVDGGQTIQAFLAAGLLQEMTITTIPVLLGSGKPLFGSLPMDISLQLVMSKAYPFGFIQSKYRVKSSA